MRIDLPQCNLKNCRKCFDGNCTDKVEYERCEFAHYKDLAEQGRLVELQQKEIYERSGDTVFFIYDGDITDVMHCGASIESDGEITVTLVADECIFQSRTPDAEHDTDPQDWCENNITITADEYMKNVFNTYAEAEQALVERNG